MHRISMQSSRLLFVQKLGGLGVFPPKKYFFNLDDCSPVYTTLNF
jgi:hypothetical protein